MHLVVGQFGEKVVRIRVRGGTLEYNREFELLFRCRGIMPLVAAGQS